MLKRRSLKVVEQTAVVGEVTEDLPSHTSGRLQHIERIEFTGLSQDTYREHLVRYHFALERIPNLQEKRVLDVPCGVGYGSATLARKAAEVVGVDISEEAVVKGRRKYLEGDGLRKPASNLKLLRMDALNLEFPDASFGAVVSFEGIEHVTDARRMLSEIRRVLEPGGVFVLSTPNREVTRNRDGHLDNPYHIREFTKAELDEMLSEQFDAVEFYGQRIIKPGREWKRRIVEGLKTLDVFDLRRFIPEGARKTVRDDIYTAGEIRKVAESEGERPCVWIAVCR
jgi:2-polyprenyl-3-methyl-5-hydroxy-6-metoxy-1,4-benzoquinol methylase